MKDIRGGEAEVKYTHCCTCSTIHGMWWGKYPSDEAASASIKVHCPADDEGTCVPSIIME